jgi:hypothetical protein
MKAKPDCTGQRFGYLVVLGKGERKERKDRKNNYRQLWNLKCDCGNIISKAREDFDSGKQVSCGCRKKEHKGRQRIDIAGQKFGTLTVVKAVDTRDKYNKPQWLFNCDCGNQCLYSVRTLHQKQYYGIRINCGDRNLHPEIWLEYPPTPSPYPALAGELLIKYLYLTELEYNQINSAVEDEKRDRLMRAAWIITYRRSQGEKFTELYEKNFISKHLAYASIDVYRRQQLEYYGGLMYDSSGNKKTIGDKMTNSTSQSYPELETLGINCMSMDNNVKINKKFKFRRC